MRTSTGRTVLRSDIMSYVVECERHGAAPAIRGRPEWPSAKTFLLARPLGVYTCARATRAADGTTQLVLWDFHLQRLTAGLPLEEAEEELQTKATASAQTLLRHWDAVHQTPVDAMLTVLWWRSMDDSTLRIDVHVCPMPQLKSPTASVLINGPGRLNASCKHSKWIEERVPLEKHMADVNALNGLGINETLLSNAESGSGDTLLLEGLVTNFFVVKDSKVFTAGSDVLIGSTRELVLKACAELGIDVVLEAPRLSERHAWQGAFVTSAVRVAVSVDKIYWHQDNDASIQEHGLDASNEIIDRIRLQIRSRNYFLDN